jgi:CheY-like chemotaxis protein/DNA-directed RNA polymerase subunit RPC12/RpoP
MEITCENCQSKLNIPDGKIPPGKTAVLTCPKCKNKISVTARPESPAPETDENGGGIYSEIISGDYDASEKPFDFIEEEGKTALICESDPSVKKVLAETLNLMEYHTKEAENVRDALTKMRYHNFNLVMVNETFDSPNPDLNGILAYLERMPMSTRRDIFVVLISSRFRTMDNMMAFNKSVNLILNVTNIGDTEKILKRSITENDLFYRVYKETMREMGRI